MLVEKFVMGMFQTNCYLLANEESKEAIVIDVPSEPTVIQDYLKKHELNLKAILLTHGHCDHILGAVLLKEATQAPIYIHEGDQIMVSSVDINLSARFPEGPIAFKGDVTLKGGETLEFGPIAVQVYHTPGHTLGSVSYVIGDRCYAGDTLFHESIGRSDLYGGSSKTLTQSIKQVLFALPDETRVYPGHGQKTTIKHEKRNNPFVR